MLSVCIVIWLHVFPSIVCSLQVITLFWWPFWFYFSILTEEEYYIYYFLFFIKMYLHFQKLFKNMFIIYLCFIMFFSLVHACSKSNFLWHFLVFNLKNVNGKHYWITTIFICITNSMVCFQLCIISTMVK